MRRISKNISISEEEFDSEFWYSYYSIIKNNKWSGMIPSYMISDNIKTIPLVKLKTIIKDYIKKD